jgi:uncharacterized protein (AIM24 family)
MAKKRTKSRRGLKVDTGCIIGFTKDGLRYRVHRRNQKLYFGGEGLFYATPRGPGTVYIQSLPLAALLIESRQHQEWRRQPRRRKYSGGLGNLLDGDNRF